MNKELEPHLHWEFMAFDIIEGTTIHWCVKVIVVGYNSEDEARVAASSIVNRKEFKLSQVWECSSCSFRERFANAVDRMNENIKG